MDIRVRETCKVCAGEGVVASQDWVAWSRKAKAAALADMEEAEKAQWIVANPCPEAPSPTCIDCDGTGRKDGWANLSDVLIDAAQNDPVEFSRIRDALAGELLT